MRSTAAEPTEIVAAFWEALYARDWPRLRSFFGPESIYYDVPTGPATAGRGPDGIEARLRLGLDGLAAYDHGPGTVVADGPVVFTEHTEHWTWPSGEEVTLPFVSVQHVDGESITLWRDYWDLQTLMNAAPAAWHERLATADLSWIFDATERMRDHGA
ncbi:MAG: nuclear transport factor 2 family protein [Acidimicrobiia bacterium]|nr:nuclear transport factor 2 family protein [Acidimicrobiia bacterium]